MPDLVYLSQARSQGGLIRPECKRGLSGHDHADTELLAGRCKRLDHEPADAGDPFTLMQEQQQLLVVFRLSAEFSAVMSSRTTGTSCSDESAKFSVVTIAFPANTFLSSYVVKEISNRKKKSNVCQVSIVTGSETERPATRFSARQIRREIQCRPTQVNSAQVSKGLLAGLPVSCH